MQAVKQTLEAQSVPGKHKDYECDQEARIQERRSPLGRPKDVQEGRLQSFGSAVECCAVRVTVKG